MGSRFVSGTQGQLYSRNISSRLFIEEKGNWVQLVKVLDTLPREVKKAAFNSMRSYAMIYERKLKSTIRDQGAGLKPPWQPHSAKYAKYKASHNPPYKGLYRWTGNLYNAIYTHSNSAAHTVIVSIKPIKAGRKKRELNAAQIALILEHGSINHNVTPRPLFHPVWKLLGGNAAMATYVSKVIQAKTDQHFKIS